MIRVAKVVALLILILFLGVGAIVGYFYFHYIDETVREGTAYGFSIGSSKRETYEIAQKLSSDGEVSEILAYPIDGRWNLNDFSPVIPQFIEVAHARNRWTLFHMERRTFLDTTRLTFEHDVLVEIHRHRQWFELP